MKKILLIVLLLVIGSEVYGDEKKCLTENIYFEARGQGQAGWLAVAQVTQNRVDDRRFPNTICEVVKQGLTYASGDPIRNKCQFSWYCDGLSDKPKDQRAWAKAIAIAEDVFFSYGLSINTVEGATFYHATTVDPAWNLEYVVTIEDHIFYR